MRNDGHGQKVSVVELGLTPDMFLTLQDYAKAGDFLAPSPRRYAELSLGKDTCGDPFNVEEQLDVETSYDMLRARTSWWLAAIAATTATSATRGYLRRPEPAMAGYTGQVTLKGSDNMTGIGAPRGQAFISALRRLEG